PHSVLLGLSNALLTVGGDDAVMTQTMAIIVNGLLMAAIVAALARIIHLPFRIERPRIASRAADLPHEEQDELARAA
ncbi:MAG: hypothetical protein ACXVRK_16100, partial [Gaiellaceae bacterium]